jgi:hypothetical protein
MNVMWQELDAEQAVTVEDAGQSRKIKHPSLPRPLWFVLSRKGNWIWLPYKQNENGFGTGYILR